MIDRAAIVEKYRAGEKVAVIAVEHGISDSHVCHIAHTAGLRRHPVTGRAAPTKKITAAFAAGLSVALIASRYRVSRQRVYQIAAEAGLRRRQQEVAR